MISARSAGLAGGLAFVLSVLACLLLLTPARSARIPDGQNLFNGYTLGASLSQYPELRVIKTWETDFVKEVGLYEHPAEEISLNGVTFQKVRYRFADRLLESIELMYQGRDSRDKLLQWVEERYGRLSPVERKMISQVEWHGDQMAITLSYDYSSKVGTLFVISPELHHRVHESIGSLPD